MKINVHMKNGLKFELDYPKQKNVGSINEIVMKFDEEMYVAFRQDVDALMSMENTDLHAQFITLKDSKKEITIRMDEITAYEVIQ